MCGFAPVTRMVGRVDGGLGVRSAELALDGCDVVLVRGVRAARSSRSSSAWTCCTPLRPSACARSTAPMRSSGPSTSFSPRPCSRRRRAYPSHDRLRAAADALEAFAELGGDVIVKPLFGSMGLGMVRIDDHDVAQRVFRALELRRHVLPAGDAAARAAATCERWSWATRGGLDRAERRRLAHEHRARRARAPRTARRAAGAPVRVGGGCPRRGLWRRRPPCARPTGATTCSRSTASPAGRASSARRGSTWRPRSRAPGDGRPVTFERAQLVGPIAPS